jgi:hypothetical protein
MLPKMAVNFENQSTMGTTNMSLQKNSTSNGRIGF